MADQPNLSEMAAVVARVPGGRNQLGVVAEALPVPGARQVRIRVAGASVNPIDLSTRAGRLADAGLMLCRAADRSRLGRRRRSSMRSATAVAVVRHRATHVVGLRTLLFAPGTPPRRWCSTSRPSPPRRCRCRSYEAATLPLNGLTADRALGLAGGCARGDTLLVTGAAGAVGGFTLELASTPRACTRSPWPGRTTRTWSATSAARDVLTSSGAAGGLAVRGRSCRAGWTPWSTPPSWASPPTTGCGTGGTFVALVRPVRPRRPSGAPRWSCRRWPRGRRPPHRAGGAGRLRAARVADPHIGALPRRGSRSCPGRGTRPPRSSGAGARCRRRPAGGSQACIVTPSSPCRDADEVIDALYRFAAGQDRRDPRPLALSVRRRRHARLHRAGSSIRT